VVTHEVTLRPAVAGVITVVVARGGAGVDAGGNAGLTGAAGVVSVMVVHRGAGSGRKSPNGLR
jgi:hypothetical protein